MSGPVGLPPALLPLLLGAAGGDMPDPTALLGGSPDLLAALAALGSDATLSGAVAAPDNGAGLQLLTALGTFTIETELPLPPGAQIELQHDLSAGRQGQLGLDREGAERSQQLQARAIVGRRDRAGKGGVAAERGERREEIGRAAEQRGRIRHVAAGRAEQQRQQRRRQSDRAAHIVTLARSSVRRDELLGDRLD